QHEPSLGWVSDAGLLAPNSCSSSNCSWFHTQCVNSIPISICKTTNKHTNKQINRQHTCDHALSKKMSADLYCCVSCCRPCRMVLSQPMRILHRRSTDRSSFTSAASRSTASSYPNRPITNEKNPIGTNRHSNNNETE